jgi:Xaa-Pro dipeptidase
MALAFPEAEYRQRLGRARQALREAGLDGYLAVAPEHLYYLAGYDGHTYWSDQGCVLTVDDDEPTLVVRDADEGVARETAWVRDVRTYRYGRDDSLALIASVVKEKGLGGARVGADLRSFALPTARGRRLLELLDPAAVEDATERIGLLRATKSAAELAYVRQAAGYANAGMEAAFAAVRPGRTEIEIAADIEYAVRSRGSDSPAMPTWMSSGHRTGYSHLTPTDRVVQPGELVLFAFAGVARRYHCSMYRTVSLGEPSARVREVYAVAEEALQTGARAAVVGAVASAVEEAALAPLRRAGVEAHLAQRFGYGVSAGYPPSWLEPLDIVRGSTQRLAAGMVFCLHCVLKFPGEFGVMVGGDFILHSDRLEFLDRTGTRLPVL